MTARADEAIAESQAVADGGSVQPDLAVVIVDHQAGDHVRRAIEALRRGSVRPGVIVVVDNAQTGDDYDEQEALAASPAVVVLRPPVNLGFAGGCNLGWRYLDASCGTVAFVNPDVEVAERGLELCWTRLRVSRTTASVSGLITHGGFGDGSFVGGATGFSHRTGKVWQDHRRPDSAVVSVPYLHGAVFLMRREVLVAVDGFDEAFFLYREEVDLCLRVTRQHLGHHEMIGESIGDHAGGVSTGPADGALRVTFMSRNYLLLARRHAGAWLPVWVLRWLLIETGIITVTKGWRRAVQHLLAVGAVRSDGLDVARKCNSV